MITKSNLVTKSQVHTPHDTNAFTDAASPNGNVKCRGVSVDVAGVIAYVDDAGNSRVTGTLVANVIHPLSTTIIKSTGTTATGIVIYW